MSRRPRLHDPALPAAEPVDPPKQVEPVEPVEVEPADLLNKADLIELFGISQPTLDRWRKHDKTFPACRWLGPATPRWSRREIEAWIASRPAGGLSPAWRALREQPHTKRRSKPKGRPKS
jgi:predicted DNA-binding transcriptional regulator AlpA